MSTSSYNNDGNYSIYVMGYNRGFPIENPPPSRPPVSIIWKVTERYKSETPEARRLIERYRSSHTYQDVFASISFTNDIRKSPESRDRISGMLSDINFPFKLDRLIWNPRGYPNRTIEHLNNADDMVSQILEVIHGTVVSGRKADLIVEVDKQYTVPHEEYEAKVKVEKERELAEYISDVKRLKTSLRTEMARLQNHHDHDQRAADMLRRICFDMEKRIAEEMRVCNISRYRVMDIVRSLESDAIRESFDQAVMRPRPASKASIEALEKFVLENGDASSECLICREQMTACKVSRMPCSHIFHDDCIVQWLKVCNHTCPSCRFKLPKERTRNRRTN